MMWMANYHLPGTVYIYGNSREESYHQFYPDPSQYGEHYEMLYETPMPEPEVYNESSEYGPSEFEPAGRMAETSEFVPFEVYEQAEWESTAIVPPAVEEPMEYYDPSLILPAVEDEPSEWYEVEAVEDLSIYDPSVFDPTVMYNAVEYDPSQLEPAEEMTEYYPTYYVDMPQYETPLYQLPMPSPQYVQLMSQYELVPQPLPPTVFMPPGGFIQQAVPSQGFTQMRFTTQEFFQGQLPPQGYIQLPVLLIPPPPQQEMPVDDARLEHVANYVQEEQPRPIQNYGREQGQMNQYRCVPYCKLCSSNKEPVHVYTTHRFRDEQTGKITCPILRKLVCLICGASGDGAHTLKYCPFNLNVPLMLRNKNWTRSREESVNALSPELAERYKKFRAEKAKKPSAKKPALKKENSTPK